MTWAWILTLSMTMLVAFLKENGAPCVVLVIDDILYGLMVALSYILRICP